MSEKRFSLYRPNSSTEQQNLESIECSVNVENGVADIEMSMLDGFSANMKIGYDGIKIIIFISDSEGNTEAVSIYKNPE